MPMRFLLSAVLFTAAVGSCLAQASHTTQADDKGTYLGLLFAPIPEAQFKKLQQLPHGQGVRVTQVLANSPAAKADLQRDDLVLAYNNEKVRDCEHFARLIINDKPNRKAKLTILRDGQEKSVEVTLALGPALRIAAPNPSIKDAAEVAKSVAKPGGPATVCVSAMPLDEGKMKVTIEFYAEGTGRIRTVVCQGGPADIDNEVEKLPERERLAAHNALERLRLLTNPKPADKKP